MDGLWRAAAMVNLVIMLCIACCYIVKEEIENAKRFRRARAASAGDVEWAEERDEDSPRKRREHIFSR